MASSYLVLYRFTCPHCSRILKAPVQWAGRKGVCPSCQKSVEFPTTALGQGNSWTSEQLHKIIASIDALMDDADTDRLAMLLAQGTCMEYRMSSELLDGRKPSARQWRRILVLAEQRESLRMDLLAHLDRPAFAEEDPLMIEGGASLSLPSLDGGGPTPGIAATQIVMRYLHHTRHGPCSGCRDNPTGMDCVYRDFESFLALAKWNRARQEKWERACRDSLGLVTVARITADSPPQ